MTCWRWYRICRADDRAQVAVRRQFPMQTVAMSVCLVATGTDSTRQSAILSMLTNMQGGRALNQPIPLSLNIGRRMKSRTDHRAISCAAIPQVGIESSTPLRLFRERRAYDGENRLLMQSSGERWLWKSPGNRVHLQGLCY